MGSHDWMTSDEANDAGWVAAKGAFLGAVKWGAAAAILAAVAHVRSPVYRGTTIQFKAFFGGSRFLQSSAMVAGGIIEADSTLREHEQRVRVHKRRLREQAKWQRYEEELIKQSQK
ncbi:hypothetical protein HJFPF1_11266 [Paramyrothecium foliicola]|nr:hypothetical protein HJFPF1_11266 [Paramyrothecium foliicola]